MGIGSLAYTAAVLSTALVPSVQAAPSPPLALKTRQGGVGVLDIAIPPNRKDDRYYTVSDALTQGSISRSCKALVLIAILRRST